MGALKRLPLPLSAVALATATLGNLVGPTSPALRLLCGGVAGGLVVLVIARLIVDSEGCRKELATPAALAVFPTLFMALMVLATYLKPVTPSLAFGMWAAALVCQLALVAVFVGRYVRAFALERVLPSWFLVFVGFVVASVTSPAFGAEQVGVVLLVVGIVGYLATLPVVMARVARLPLPAPALPTLTIFAAPPSLCLAGYMAVVQDKQPLVVWALLAFIVASVAFLLVRLPKMLRAPFSPAYAAFTFPTVITAVAVKQAYGFLAGDVPLPLAYAIYSAAGLAVVYVLARFAVSFAAPVAPAAAEQPAAG